MMSEKAGQPLQFKPFADALLALGYAPRERLGGAAARLARTPQLLADIQAYLKSGTPPPDDQAKTPPELFRSLPGNYSVAALIRDFQLEPVGAFLIASDLMADTTPTLKRLNQIIEEGYWKMLPDGSYAKVILPISDQYPACPNCGMHWVTNYPACPRCGYGPREEQIDQDFKIMELLQEGGDHPSPEADMVWPDIGDDEIIQSDSFAACPHCGSLVKHGVDFCASCGKPLARAGECPRCGKPVNPQAHFCPSCGASLSAIR